MQSCTCLPAKPPKFGPATASAGWCGFSQSGRMQAILGEGTGVVPGLSRESLVVGHLSGKPTIRPCGTWSVNASPFVATYPAFLDSRPRWV